MNDTDKTSDKMQNEIKKKHNWKAKTYKAPWKQTTIDDKNKHKAKQQANTCNM